MSKSSARKRTTHRSVAGKKIYAVRDAKGRFIDIQTYERAHRQDLKKRSESEFLQKQLGFKQVVAEKATASEIRKALRIKPENTQRIRQVIRDLEAKNWPVD